MKNLFFCAIFMISVLTTYAAHKEISGVIKGGSEEDGLFADMKKLARASLVLNEQKFYPLAIGDKFFTIEECNRLTETQRKLIGDISHPGCCRRLCGHDYSITSEYNIKALEQEIPDLMKGHKILKIKSPRPLCCKS